MGRIFKTRRGTLEEKIRLELSKNLPDLNNIILAIEKYEKDNVDTIDKLKKHKKIDMNRINGALKQTIHAHGPITKTLIGSASKRIYGSLIENPNQSKLKSKISLRDTLLGLFIGILLMSLCLIIF